MMMMMMSLLLLLLLGGGIELYGFHVAHIATIHRVHHDGEWIVEGLATAVSSRPVSSPSPSSRASATVAAQGIE